MIKKIRTTAFWLLLVVIFVLAGSIPSYLFTKFIFLHNHQNWLLMSVAISSYIFMYLLPRGIEKYKKDEEKSSLSVRLTSQEIYTSFRYLVFYTFCVILLSKTESFREYYTPNSLGLFNTPFVFIFSSFIYYFSEEYLFRGFLLSKLSKYSNSYGVFLTSTLFAFLHLTKTFPEVIFSFILGVGLGFLTIKVKSVWPAIIIHFSIAIILNVLIYLAI